jgi:ABC-type spermidine/putrescine transport system permease subunit I
MYGTYIILITSFKRRKIMETINNNKSIKEDIIMVFKESMKFALVGVILFLVIGTSIAYILLEIIGMDIEVTGILTGIVVAILIVTVDYKKMHTTDKITECNRRIIRKILKI